MTQFDAGTTVRQIGIRQRSLRRTCRLGRATELVFILATGVTLTLSGQAGAQTWDGSTSGNFVTGTNWVGDVAPGLGDNVVLNIAGGNQPTLGSGDFADVDSVAVSAGLLQVNGDLFTTSGVTVTGGSVQVGFTGAIFGDAATGAAGSLTMAGMQFGNVTNAGTFTLTSGGTVFGGVVNSSGTGTNNGAISGTLAVSGGTFNNAGSVGGVTNVTGGVLNLNGGTDLADAQALTITAGTVNVNADDTVGNLSGAGALVFSAGNGLTTNITGGSTFSGAISGATTLSDSFLVKQGAGSLTLSGANTTTGAGRVAVMGGTLVLQGGNALGNNNLLDINAGLVDLQASETVGVLLGSVGGTLDLNANTITLAGIGSPTFAFSNATITGTGGLTLNATGFTQEFTEGLSYTGTTTISAGTFQLGANDILDDDSSVVVNGGTLAMQGFNDTVDSVSLQAGAISGTGTLTSLADFDVRSGTALAALGGTVGLTKTTAGNVTLSGANTYTGATTISAGTLTAASSGALGTAAGGTTVDTGATLAVQGGITLTDAITLNGAGVASVGALHSISGTNNINGTVTLGSNAAVLMDAGQLNLQSITGTNHTLTVGGSGGDLHLFGAITTGTGGLIKTGGNTVWVEGVNTFTGNTTIEGGILDLQNGSALSDTGLVTVTAGTLIVRDSETVGNISGAGNIAIVAGETLTAGDATLTSVFSGQIINDGGLTKQGTGTLTLSNANTYAGATTVNGGILDVTGSIASLVVNVNTGGTLQADGSALNNLAAVTLAGTGNLTLTGSEEIGSLAGTGGTVTLGANTLTTGGANSSTTFAGVISGSGGLTKAGSGTMTLTGANTFTGPTAVTSGGLTVTGTGALASAAVNVTGGTLTTDADALAAGTTVSVSTTGTFTSSGSDTFTAINQTGGTVNGSGVLTLTGAFTQSGGSTGGTVDINAATFTQSGGATLAAGTTVTSAGAQSLQGGTIAGALDGAGALTAASGTTALSGTVTNAASLTVSGGTVNLTGTGSLDTSTNAIAVSAGTLTNDGDGIADTEVVTVSGAGTLTTNGTDTVGSVIQTGGTINGSAVLTGATFTQSGGGTLAGQLATTTGATLNGGTISGTLSGGPALVQTGTTTVTGTITGNVTVDGAGRLRIGHSDAIGGTITTTGSVISYANGVNEASALILNSNTTQLEVLAADIATQTGVISETGGARPLEKIGTGTLTLAGANTFTGDMTISAGTLALTNGSALADVVEVAVGNGGTLNIVAAERIGALSSVDTNPATSTAAVILASDLTIGGAQDTTFAGVISGAGQLSNDGTGTLTLTGVNTLTGALFASGAGAEFALTGNGSVASADLIGAENGALITTDGGAFADSTVDLVIENATLTLNGSETAGSLGGNSVPEFTGTVNLNGPTTVLTLNGTGAFATVIAGTVAGTGTMNVTGSTATILAAGNVQTATTIGSAGTVINGGAMAAVSNAGVFTNTGTAGALTNTGAGSGSSSGTLASLAHNSSGAFTNTGAVTGATTVSAGTVTLNGGSNLGNAAALTVTGGAVILNTADTVGSLVANGGTTTLNAVLTAGTLSGTAGSIVSGAAGGLVVGSVASSSYAGVYSGAGFLQKVGAGTQTMTGANTYTGGTTVTAGTLAFTGTGSALNTSFVTIDPAAILSSDGGAFAVSLAITNNGALALTAGGDESIASVNGAGTIALSSGSVLTLNTGVSALGGVISGAGGLTVAGTSATTLSALNTFTGATTVSAGSLTMAATGSTVSTTTNNGGTVTNNGGAFAAVNNSAGTFNNTTGTAGAVTNAATATNGGTIASLSNTGGTFSNTVGGAVSGTSTISGGTVTNNGGAFAAVNNTAGTFNNTTGTAGAVTNAATASNGGTIASLSNTGGTFANTGIVTGASTVSGGAVTNSGSFGSTLGVSGGTFTNNVGGLVSGTTSNTGGTVTNNGGTLAAVINTTGTFNNTTGTAGAVTNAATATNGGTIASLNNTGGTFANSGTVSGASTITGGTVTNTGTMAAVTNAAIYTATGATTGALTNTGTATVTGGTTASVTNNAGTTTLAGATITGAVDNNAGTVTTSGVTSAATLSNDATVNASGTLDAVVTNTAGAAFNVTAALNGGAKAFTNAGTLNVTTASYTNLGAFTNNASGLVNLSGPLTLAATSLNNAGGTMIMGSGSTIAGAFTNGGVLRSSGSTTINGSFVNNGTVDLANGATGDILTITGATSGTGLYQLDLNLSTGATDRVNAPVGVAQIHLDFDTVGGGILLPPVVVFSGAAAGATLTQQDLPVGGAVLYSIQQAGNDVRVVSSINPAVSGVAASAAMTQSLISTVVNRPTSPFVSGLAAEEGCSHGGYFRASAGMAKVKGTATSNSVSSTSDISSRFSGVQGGYDVGCFDGRFFNGWDGAMGLLAGYNTGSTSQSVFSDPINPTLQTGTSGSDFKQSYLGLYAAGSKDRFSGDVQLRFDKTDFDLKETALAGFEVGLDGLSYATKSTTFGTRINYRFDLDEEKGINFVPTIGFNYTTVSGNMLTLDDMGTLSTADDETLQIDGYNTVVGFLGGTLAKTKIDPEGTSATTTFISGNYYHDFGGDRTASYDNSVLGGPEGISIGSIGGFAEASMGVNFVKILENGPGGAKQLNANVRADARFGANVSDSYSITAQIRLSF